MLAEPQIGFETLNLSSSLLAALRLISEIEEAGAGVLTAPPHLSPATRVGLLARARWFGLRFGLP